MTILATTQLPKTILISFSLWHNANFSTTLSLAETPEAEKMDTDTDSQQADKVFEHSSSLPLGV